MQLHFEGFKEYIDEKEQLQKLWHNNTKDPLLLDKSTTSYTVPGLVPKLEYIFAISASFMDGKWGQQVIRKVETSAAGKSLLDKLSLRQTNCNKN